MNYYEVLGVNRSASLQDIKFAFRNIAKMTHPDSAGENANIEKFRKATEAYSVLSDKKQREEYNSFLDSGNKSENFEYSKDKYEEVQNTFNAVYAQINEYSSAARRKIFGGLGWLAVGIIASIISYNAASPGSTYTIFTGAIVVGIGGLIVGVYRSIKINKLRDEFEREFWSSF